MHTPVFYRSICRNKSRIGYIAENFVKEFTKFQKSSPDYYDQIFPLYYDDFSNIMKRFSCIRYFMTGAGRTRSTRDPEDKKEA